MVTIFTPVYNRAHLMMNLYCSLLRQTNYDFEWLVIDDGSEDDIAGLMHKWMHSGQTPFAVRFYQQENGGKHRAVNRGIQLAQGDAFFIVDSDDYLLEDAVAHIHAWWRGISGDDSYAGVSGLKKTRDGKIVGGTPPFVGFVDATNMERAEYGLLKDKAEVYKTSVLRKYPFPEFEGENFLTESVVWDRIAYDGLKIRWFNKVIYICEYRGDGLTRQGWSLLIKNPAGWGCQIQQKCRFYSLPDGARIQQYLIYYTGLKDRLSDNEIMHGLGIDGQTLGRVKKLFQSCIERTVQQIGKKIVLYGLGARGRKVLKLYQGSEVEICCVMDKAQKEPAYRQVPLNGPCPAADAVIVTPKYQQEEIMQFLRTKTDTRLIGYDEWKSCIGLGQNF